MSDSRSDNDNRDDGALLRSSFAFDEVAKVMAKTRRRYLVRHLVGMDGEVATYEDVVEHLDERLPEADRRSLETRLHHIDLPMLADAGVLDYDPRTQTVRYWSDDFLEALVSLVGEEERDER